ncbi:MAG: SGNH/GDSL hydrolase family protein [Daejeonella sp.]
MNKTYLALGDSYTIGEAVEQSQSFPYQLSSKLNGAGIKTEKPEIIATTGWTTAELIAAIKQRNIQKKFDLVTLLIGVNNQYRGYSQETYRAEFRELLNTAIDYANGNLKNVYVVSIPDWGVTPFAQNSGRDIQKISDEIDQFNAINKEETAARGITYIDITPESRKAKTDVSLVASDGLHPSGKMYEYWAEQLKIAIAK